MSFLVKIIHKKFDSRILLYKIENSVVALLGMCGQQAFLNVKDCYYSKNLRYIFNIHSRCIFLPNNSIAKG